MTGRENHTAELKRLRDEERLAILDAYRGPRLVELFARLTGKQPSKVTAREARYGGAGSLWVNLTRGTFRDHEAGVGGGVIKAVEHYIGTDYAGAIRYLRDDLGLPVDGPVPQLSDYDKEKREAERLALDLADSESERENLERARQIWDGGRHISGTPGYKYLATTRAIGTQATDKLTADIVRWHDAGRYLVFKVTDDAGEFTGIQRIAVTHDGQKDLRWRSGKKPSAKLSLGPIGRGVVRLPGNSSGPLCHAEGAETGLSATAAGFEVHVALGGRLIKPAPGRMTVYLRDDDKRNPKTERTRRQTMRQWRKEGLTFADATPFEQRREKKQDFNDLLKERGVEAVGARITLFAYEQAPVERNYAQLNDARDKLNKAVGDIIEQCERFDREAGQTAPVCAIKITTGGGKTEAALRNIYYRLKIMRAAGDKRVFVYLAPYHELNAKLLERWRAIAGEELSAAIWRGRESRKPNASDKDDKMCDRIEDVRLAQKLRVKVGEELCSHCSLADRCAYMAQRQQHADIWFAAHQAIYSRIPKTIGANNVAGVIIDETPWQSGLITNVDVPASWLTDGALPLPDIGGDRLADMRLYFRQAVERVAEGIKHGEVRHLTKTALVKYGFEADAADLAAKLERAREVTDGPWQLRTDNRTVGPLVMSWCAARDLLAGDDDATDRMTVWLNEDKALVLTLSGRQDIHEDWRKPTLLIDASLEPDLLREFWPDIRIAGEFAIDAPHMTVHQVQGRAFSKRMLAPLLAPPPVNDPDKLADYEALKKYKARSRRSLRAFILRMDRKNDGKTVAIGNLDIIEALKLPAHILTAHFNALVGLDQFGDARTIIVVGRPLPGPQIVEDMAGALTGRVIEKLPGGEWYQRQDATLYRRTPAGVVPVIGETVGHPDKTAELIRRRICEGEVEQAIGRGRGINRTAADPLDVYLLSDVALDLPIDNFIDPEDVIAPTPFDLMHGEGGIVLPDAPTDAARLYPSLWRNPDAARQAWVRSRSVTLPEKDSLSGNVTHLRPITYLRAGPGQRPQTGWFDPRMVSDPRATIEAALGALAKFEIVGPPVEQGVEVVPIAAGSVALAASADGETSRRREVVEVVASAEAQGRGAATVAATGAAIASVAGLSGGRAIVIGAGAWIVSPVERPKPGANDGAAVPPEPFIDWPAIRQTAADCGHGMGFIATQYFHRSPSHFRNLQTGFRNATAEDAAAAEAYLRDARAIQGRLL